MKHIAAFAIALIMACMAQPSSAQQPVAPSKYKTTYQVKKKETVYGISRMFGITEQQLIEANPQIDFSKSKLKKDELVNIPWSKAELDSITKASQPSYQVVKEKKDKYVPGKRPIRIGVLLPLHNDNGDGKRMVEYYRGVIMACDSLKREGINTEISAWNAAEDADVAKLLQTNDANLCDIIFGPLYTRQMPVVSKFCADNDIRLLIPFSIEGKETEINANIYKVYQTRAEQNARTVKEFCNLFRDYNVVLINCNDNDAGRADFTTPLREALAAQGTSLRITSVTSTDIDFANAFSTTQKNIVMLNSEGWEPLKSVLLSLDRMMENSPEGQKPVVSMFGYTRWFIYETTIIDRLYQYDSYIPTTYYYARSSKKSKAMEARYNTLFGTKMMVDYTPRMGLTGYDHAMYMIKGLYTHGESFAGGEVDYKPLQSPLHFFRLGGHGGLQNDSYMFIHYNRSKQITKVTF